MHPFGIIEYQPLHLNPRPLLPSCSKRRPLLPFCILAVLAGVLVTSIYFLTEPRALTMGQATSSPLALTLSRWSEVRDRAHNLSLTIKKGRWQTLCSSEWPAFQVGWPPEGSFQAPLIDAVRSVIFRSNPYGHPDQQPYILVWTDLCVNPPTWVRPFLPACPPTLKTSGSTTTVLPMKTSPPPSSLYPALPPPPSVLPESQADLIQFDMGTRPPPLYSPSRATPPQASAPETPSSPEAPSPQASAPEAPSSPEAPSPQASAPEAFPSSETIPVSPKSPPQVENDGGPAQRTRNRRAQDPQDVAVALPLRPYGPMMDDGNGGEMPSLQYWPFSSSDLYNWKHNNPPFSEDPTKLINLLDSLMHSHQPTWDDCRQLLNTLFTHEERERIVTEARKLVPGPAGQPTQDEDLIEEYFPRRRPTWDPNTPQGREHLSIYRRTLMAGLQAAARRPTNLAKVREIAQGPDESPAAFLERIMEAYRRYTPFDPQDEHARSSVAFTFVNQSALDIRRKLQHMDGMQYATLRDLVKEAEKVYYKRETEEEKEMRKEREREEKEEKRRKEDDRRRSREKREDERRRDKELTKILAAVVSGNPKEVDKDMPRRRPPLEPNQCAYCKEIGHFIKDCIKLKKKKEREQQTMGGSRRQPNVLALEEDD